jgi:transcriptional regulator with XRE-family HTH domain
MNWYEVSDKVVLNELTKRVKRKRLNVNMTQQELAKKSGVHVNTIRNFENGRTTSLLTLIQILRAFNELEFIDKLMPEPGISPVELFKLKGNERARASGKKSKESGEANSTW